MNKKDSNSNDLKDFFKGFSDAEDRLEFKMGNECDKVETLSTGSPGLDNILFGGIPKGRITQFYGKSGSGKTFAAMLAIKEAQKENSAAVQIFADVEQTFNADWCTSIGIDVSKVGVLDGDSASNGKELFERILGTPKEDRSHMYVGKNKHGLLDKIVDGELNINLLIIDSIGAIIPPIEAVSSPSKYNMAPLSRFLTPAFKKLSVEVSKANIPVIVINHVKDSLDPFGGNTPQFSGGNTFTHHLSANVFFEVVTRKDTAILDENENKIGHLIRATTYKLKQGPWPRKCEFKVNFSSGVVDLHEEIATLALDYDIVTKPSIMSYEYGDQKWVGAAKFNEALANDPVLAEEILAKIKLARDSKLTPSISEEKTLEDSEVPESTKRGRKAK